MNLHNSDDSKYAPLNIPAKRPAEPTDARQVMLAKTMMTLETRIRNGANNFFWIAGLSLVNTFIFLSGGSTSFVMGLGITQIIDGLAQGLAEESAVSAGMINAIALLIDAVIAGMFILFGVLARKKNRTVILFGGILYLMDALIYLLVQDWYAMLFHGLMLVGLWNAFRATGQLQKMEEEFSSGGLSAAVNVIPQAAAQPPVDKKIKYRNLALVALALLVPLGIFVIMVLISYLRLQ